MAKILKSNLKNLIKRPPKEFTKLIYDSYKSKEDPEMAAEMKKFMKDNFEFIGLRRPERIAQLGEVVNTYVFDPLERHGIHSVLQECYQYEEREMHNTAVNILDIYWLDSLNTEDLPILEELICTHSHWDSTDTLAKFFGYVLEDMSKEEREVYSKQWLEHENMWMRRISLIYQLKYGDKIDLDVVFGYSEALMHEKDFFIRKAIGWILREASKRRTQEVIDFVRSNEDNLSHLSKVEAMRYILKRKDTERYRDFEIPQYRVKRGASKADEHQSE